MKSVIFAVALILVSRPCTSRSMPEELSVVSVYTTLPTTAGTASLDVYQQIANNIAERITSPIYRFLGINNSTATTTKRPWDKVEILDDPEVKTDVDNTISKNRDVEEVSTEGAKKTDKKPEKITLYSSYLPSKLTDKNVTSNEIPDDDDDSFGFDDDIEDDRATPREGPFTYMFELIGSIITLLWNGFISFFRPSSDTRNN